MQKQVISIPISEGLDNKTDSKLVEAGKAITLENARFFKAGQLRKRFGQAVLSNVTNSGMLSDEVPRAIVSDQDFLATITDEGIFGYSEGDDEWYKQSAFGFSSKITTSFVSKNPFNQKGQDMDVTTDETHAAYVCKQSATDFGNNILITLEDLSTGLKKTANVLTIGNDTGLQRILVAKSAGVLYVHVFYFDGTNINKIIYDKNLSVVSGPSVVLAGSDAGNFDVCKDSDTIFFAYIAGTAIDLRSYAFNGTAVNTLTGTVSSALRTTNGFGRSVSIEYASGALHVAWSNSGGGGGLKGYTKALAATIAEVDFLAQLQKLSICSNGPGLSIVSDSEDFSSQVCLFNYSTATFTTTYSVTSVSDYERVVIAAKPFLINEKVFALVRTNETENKSFFVFNLTDSYIVQVFSPRLAAPTVIDGATSEAAVSKTVVIGMVARANIARVYAFDEGDFYTSSTASSLTVHDFTDLDDDGCKTKVGDRIHYTAGATIEVDNANPHENGFVFAPKITSITEENTGGSANANIASKTFNYIAVYEYLDSSGQLTRSALSEPASITTTSAARWIILNIRTPVASLKSKVSLTNFNSAVNIVTYRTQSPSGTTYYRCNEKITTFNDGAETTILDTEADSDTINNQIIYTTGGVLENNPAPIARFSTSGGGRLFLGGLEEKDEIAFSKKHLFGESVAFNDQLRLRISSGTNADKSKLSAVGFMDGKIIVFRKNTIYYVAGDGPNETGSNDSYTAPEVISSDTGCDDPRSVLNVPSGIMFKSPKGIYLLDRSLQVTYIGSPVEDFNSGKIVSAVLHEKFNEARFYTSAGQCLVYNYAFGTWSVDTNQSSLDADNWQNRPVLIRDNRIYSENDELFMDDGDPFSLKYKTPWLKLNGIQDFGRIWTMTILGEFKSAHTLQVKVYYDYATDYVETYPVSPLVSDSQYQYRIHLKKQKCESIQFEIQDLDQSGTGESMELTALTLEVGLKKGSMKLSAARKY